MKPQPPWPFWLSLFACLSVLPPLLAQSSADCSSDPYYAKLDFWLGEWDVFNQEGEKAGTNSISRILDGCAVEEKWTDADGNQGRSLFYVDQATRTWHQVWVMESANRAGGQKHKVLVEELEGGALRFQGSYPYQGQEIMDRTTLTPGANGQVEQLIERSFDGGDNWQPGFYGTYIPARSDKAQLEAIHREYVEGWLAMDEERILDLFEEEARLQPGSLKPIEGIEQMRAFWFPDDGSVTTVHQFETRPLAMEIMDTLAVASYASLLDWSYQKDSTRFGMVQRGINTVLYRKQADGRWKIWRRMWTDYSARRK